MTAKIQRPSGDGGGRRTAAAFWKLPTCAGAESVAAAAARACPPPQAPRASGGSRPQDARPSTRCTASKRGCCRAGPSQACSSAGTPEQQPESLPSGTDTARPHGGTGDLPETTAFRSQQVAFRSTPFVPQQARLGRRDTRRWAGRGREDRGSRGARQRTHGASRSTRTAAASL